MDIHIGLAVAFGFILGLLTAGAYRLQSDKSKRP